MKTTTTMTALLLAALLQGCGGGDADADEPGLGPVTGTVEQPFCPGPSQLPHFVGPLPLQCLQPETT